MLGVGGVAPLDDTRSSSSGACGKVGVLGAVNVPSEWGWDFSPRNVDELCRPFNPGDLRVYFRLHSYLAGFELRGSISSDFAYR